MPEHLFRAVFWATIVQINFKIINKLFNNAEPSSSSCAHRQTTPPPSPDSNNPVHPRPAAVDHGPNLLSTFPVQFGSEEPEI